MSNSREGSLFVAESPAPPTQNQVQPAGTQALSVARTALAIAPAQNANQANPAVVIIIDDEEEVIIIEDEEEEDCVFQHGPLLRRSMPRSQVLGFVRRTGVEIFERQAAEAIWEEDQVIWIDIRDSIRTAGKSKILDRYQRAWSAQLDEEVKTRAKALASYRKLVEKLDTEREKRSFTDDFVVPKENLHREAQDDVGMMAALINFLDTN